jgi:hypothetical protein
MLILDNSEYMRNGDYQPSRFDALADAVKSVFTTKIDSNPENTVGVMTMANKGCVLAAVTIKNPRSFHPNDNQSRGARHTHQGDRSDPHCRAQHVHEPRAHRLHPHRDRNRATCAQAPAEQEPPSARDRFRRFPARGYLPGRRARLDPSRQETQEEQRRARPSRVWRRHRGGRRERP